MTSDAHTGQPTLTRYANGVAILCPHGHLVATVREDDWAHSSWEAAITSGQEVSCRGTL